jgi:phosphate transport system substrate-binding protein
MRPTGFTLSADTTVFTADNAIAEAVLNDINGIGFVAFSGIGTSQALSIRGECRLQSAPTEFAIKTEEYPLTRLLYMYQTNAPLAAKATQLRDYILTDEAQEHVGDWGFVNQAISVESVNTQGLRIASAIIENREAQDMAQVLDMIVLFAAADRLSTTFRFETGTADLNSRSQADVLRLAKVLATDRFANKEIIFVGFTDSIGDGELNRQLSQQRDEQVLQTVLAKDPSLASNVRMQAVGFGEISPLGCNESDVGRLTNRRVEVWVRDIAEAG